jgi:hypothetical protein
MQKLDLPPEIKAGSCLLGFVSMGVGAYHGYCDAKGLGFSQQNLEFWLTWGPTIVTASLGGLTGILYGPQMARTMTVDGERVPNPEAVGCVSGLLGGTIGGAVGGGLNTLFGYGVGYGVGYIVAHTAAK